MSPARPPSQATAQNRDHPQPPEALCGGPSGSELRQRAIPFRRIELESGLSIPHWP